MIRATFQENFNVEEQDSAPLECGKVKVAVRFQNSQKFEFNFPATEPTQVQCTLDGLEVDMYYVL